MKIVIGISGASGVIYGIEFLRACKKYFIETNLILTHWAEETIKIETSFTIDEVKSLASYTYDNTNMTVSLSSGSFKHDGMVIVPCSMKTLSAIAHGYSISLIHRAADVTLKENRKLILMPRETPLNAIHLESMLKLSRLGTIMMPLMPAMYFKPSSIEDITIHMASRILDQLGVDNDYSKRWNG